jgi:uroporphyrinogen III methyltransferase/synthase
MSKLRPEPLPAEGVEGLAGRPGKLYLVGAGPGETGLITAKGLALVREAEAIVGDLLVHTQLLREARPEAELHDVGCRAGQNKIPQDEISRRLIDLARQGKMVVRLWPGDPFIFGRATQEIAAAHQAGIKVELVPGVTSAIAAPAYAGVPVTDWEHNTCFAVVSGYRSKNPAVAANWTALAQMETLVIMMPLDNLPELVDRLRSAGRPAETPALAVQHGSLPEQKQVLATLGSLVEAVTRHRLEDPAIVVVGGVAGLAAELAWFQPAESPLAGRRVLVTRPVPQAADFMRALRDLGAEPVSFPTIEIRPLADTHLLDAAIRRLGAGEQNPVEAPPYHWLALTSANGVAAFWAGLQRAGLDSRCLASLKIAAIGPATAAALQQRSINPDLIPEIYTAEGVLEAFDRLGPVAGQRFLLARADIARPALAQGLRERGALVEEIAAYQTVPLQAGPLPPFADIVTFTSSSTVQGYANCLGSRSPADFLKDSQVVCIGPITAATARELGLPVSAVAESYTIEGVLEALKQL